MSVTKTPASTDPVQLVDEGGNDLTGELKSIRKLLERMMLQNEQIIDLLERHTDLRRDENAG